MGMVASLVSLTVALAEPPTDKLRYTAELDVSYRQVDETDLKADIYQPKDAQAACPVVVIVHGGAWRTGGKWMPATYGRLLAENKIAAVSINYRLAPKHKFPDQVDDVRAALAWVADQAEHRRWDVDRIGMFGYSAGAHLCCMIGTQVDEPAETIRKTTRLDANDPVWKQLPKPVAVVAGGTPAEFRTIPMDSSMLAYFLGGTRREHPETYRYASPTSLVSAGDVPTLFYHGTADWIVPIASAQSIFAAQRAAGVDSEFVTVEGQGHMLTFMHDSVRPKILEFFQSKLGVN